MNVSVLIPAYNAEATLEAAIRSVWDQTVRPLEVIVADDGSSDSTSEIAEASGAQVLRLPRGNGSIARNRAAEAAQGDLLFFLDADDAWTPTKIEAHLQVWKESDPSFVVDVATKRLPSGETCGLLGAGPEGSVEWEQFLLWTTWTSGSSFSVPKAKYDAIGGFSENLISQQDVDFWVRCAHQFGPAHRIAASHTFYTISPGGVSKIPQKVEENLERVLEKWPFANEAQKREFRMQMLLTAAGFSRLPECLYYYKVAGYPVHKLKLWRSLARSIVKTAKER